MKEDPMEQALKGHELRQERRAVMVENTVEDIYNDSDMSWLIDEVMQDATFRQELWDIVRKQPTPYSTVGDALCNEVHEAVVHFATEEVDGEYFP